MKVKLIKKENSEDSMPSLTLGKIYEVLAIEYDCYRILTNSDSWPYGNDPVLYETELFEIVDSIEPDFWVTTFEDGERLSNPFVWNNYFFEKYHDGNFNIQSDFIQHLKQYYPWTWHERFRS